MFHRTPARPELPSAFKLSFFISLFALCFMLTLGAVAHAAESDDLERAIVEAALESAELEIDWFQLDDIPARELEIARTAQLMEDNCIQFHSFAPQAFAMGDGPQAMAPGEVTFYRIVGRRIPDCVIAP